MKPIEGVRHQLALDGFAVIRNKRYSYTSGTIIHHPVLLVVSNTHVSGYWPDYLPTETRVGKAFRVKHDGRKFRFGGGATGFHQGTFYFEDVIPQPLQLMIG